MQAYQRADGDATSVLVERLSPMLLRFLAGPLQTRDHADDMLQDCWMRIHRARHTYRPGSPLLPWVFAIARHTRVDAYRRRSQITRRELVSDDLEAAGAASVDPPAPDHGDIWKLVQELPESQQEVVKMLKVAGLSLEETARATGSTVGSVKQKAHRAYRRLRELLIARGLGR
jgi:RNA polymerase sigma-70 factor (ECF subfamily)